MGSAQGTKAVANALLDIGCLVQDYGMVKAYEHGISYSGTYYVDPDMVSDFRMLSTATAEDVGKVVCAAGHLHDAKTAVPDGCTAVGVLGKVTSTGHGLILALQNATSQNWNTINGWESVPASVPAVRTSSWLMAYRLQRSPRSTSTSERET